MFIYIARHAWAGERGDPRWPDDSLRELTPEGIARYAKLVKILANQGFDPDRIATSPYTRCRQTAELIAKHVVGDPAIDELQALEPGSDLETLIQWSQDHAGKAESLCWVGHSPDVEDLTGALISDSNAGVRFAKGGVAAISFADEIAPASGELHWHVTAKVLGV